MLNEFDEKFRVEVLKALQEDVIPAFLKIETGRAKCIVSSFKILLTFFDVWGSKLYEMVSLKTNNYYPPVRSAISVPPYSVMLTIGMCVKNFYKDAAMNGVFDPVKWYDDVYLVTVEKALRSTKK